MAVTIYDIAEQAGVSIATVSRVFNKSPRVTAKTSEKVMAVARRLNYSPNVSAQSLARQQTHVISAVVPIMANYFYIEVMRGIQDKLAESDYDLLIYAARDVAHLDSQLERALQKGRGEGVLLFSVPLTDERSALIKRSGQPVVLVDANFPDYDSISVDNYLGGKIATDHLIKLGRKNIAFIGAHKDSNPSKDRREGYLEALKSAGMTSNPKMIVECPEAGVEDFTEAIGAELTQTLLDQNEKIDAVFVASDIQALGVLKVLESNGLNVPNDVAVVGFDDIEISKYVGLSTITQPMRQMGETAMTHLLSRMKDKKRSAVHTKFSPEIVVRKTTGE